jgi:O-antigen biosynthesis protein WbqP
MRLFLSLFLLTLFSPILIIISIVIILDDGFPIFFKQKRIGKNNIHFLIYKFRTMKKNTPDIPTHLMTHNKNVYTKIGPFLRKYSLDELPQLINIIKGEMNFIGPRPALYNQKDLIRERTKINIHHLKPGVTGWAQTNGRDELEIDEKVKMDFYYLKNQSFSLDIKILFLTFIKSIKSDGVFS